MTAAADTQVLRLRDLTHRYGAFTALDGVTLDLPPGITCVAGANGSGKSTLLDVVAGHRAPSSGAVAGLGFDVADSSRTVGYLPQAFSFARSTTLLDTVLLSLWLRGFGYEDAMRRALAALAAVGLSEDADKRAGQASGGMLRRTGFAVAIAHDPLLLILDEPTTGVDAAQRRAMREIIATQAGRRIVLMSSHIAEDIDMLADQLVVLARGRVTYVGAPAGAVAASQTDSLEAAIIALSA